MGCPMQLATRRITNMLMFNGDIEGRFKPNQCDTNMKDFQHHLMWTKSSGVAPCLHCLWGCIHVHLLAFVCIAFFAVSICSPPPPPGLCRHVVVHTINPRVFPQKNPIPTTFFTKKQIRPIFFT